MKLRLLLFFCVFFIFALPLAAQDEETDTDTGTAPEIISLTPETLTISGGSSDSIEVEYEDADGDASRFIWEVFDADEGTSWNLPDGFFSQAVVGTTIPVTFRCDNVDATVSIQLIVADSQGNQSEPATFDLVCESSLTDPGRGGGASGTAPEVVSVTPSRMVVSGVGTATTEIEYTDAEGDASRFLWSIVDAGEDTSWTLVDGFFSQAIVGTTIPVTFRCETVFTTQTLEMQLIVEDEAGNQSEPVTLTLVCEVGG